MMSSECTSTLSTCSMVYHYLFQHLESYINGGDASSSVPPKENVPEWLSRAAEKGWVKLQKYYPDSDGGVYVVGTSKLRTFVCVDELP